MSAEVLSEDYWVIVRASAGSKQPVWVVDLSEVAEMIFRHKRAA